MTVELPSVFPYQEYQIQKIIQRRKTGVISPPGSGKTRVPIEALVRMGLVDPHLGAQEPILVVCTGPAVGAWKWQFPHWSQSPVLVKEIFVVRGKPEQRRALWEQAQRGVPGIYIVNSQLFWRDYEYIAEKVTHSHKAGSHWAALIADEYHKYMRRRSETFKKFTSIARNIKYVVLTTGSVMSKDPSSMYTLFHLCDPQQFRSYWKFVYTFCIVDESGFGKQIIGPRNVENLKILMDEYLGFVPREVVADQLPGGNRRRLYVEMTPPQEKAYNAICDEMILELEDGGLVVAPTVLSKLTLLRKLLCIPSMIDPSLGCGGGFEAILERLEEQPHAVIFVPFRDACDKVKDALYDAGYMDVHVLRGGLTNEEQSRTVQLFKEHRSIIVCTIAYAESFDLETCDTSYFLGYEHNVEQNQQAEGRTQRAISEFDAVWWHYVAYTNTHDEDMLENLNRGHANVRRVLSRPDEMLQLLKGHKK